MELTNLEEAISNVQQSVNMVNNTHQDKPLFLNSLGSCQRRRFMHLHDPTNLNDSISNLQQVVQLTEDTHPNKQKYLYNLSAAQCERCSSVGELKDIEDFTSNIGKAIDLTNDGHPDKPNQVAGLSMSQFVLFDHFGGLANLKNAVSNLQKSIHLIEDDHPQMGFYLFRRGTILGRHLKLLGETEDLTAAVAAFQKSAQLNSTTPFFAFHSVRDRAELAHHNGDLSSALHRYRAALDIMPKLAWLGLSRSAHHFLLSEGHFEDLGCLSATCNVQQVSSIRPELETLKEVAPELANQLKRVGQRLDASDFYGIDLGEVAEVGDDRHPLVGEGRVGGEG
jgi:tetratricopeptide (TPR) repeat protein